MTGRLITGIARAFAAVFLAATPATAAYAGEMAVVASHVIYPGQTVSAGALREIQLRNGYQSPTPFVRAPGEIVNKIALRTILPGRLIPEGSVRDAFLVEAGKPARIVYSQGALTITMIAVALEPGSAGDVVKVRNPDSGAVFSGIVMADGTIRVGGA
ncbi:MAG TPA: flagellar basal body P-ring formation chaperone FlgA [Rhizobiaceae bacterium]|nr:flagellar basal body P-ring formation chaperone FlgA [Rhizobiaceae bacterium]